VEPQICSAPMTVIAFRSTLGMVRAECFSVQFFNRIAPANLLGFARLAGVEQGEAFEAWNTADRRDERAGTQQRDEKGSGRTRCQR
jgi:hypothetical protein